MLVATIAAVLFGQQTVGLDKPVSLEINTAPLPRVMEELERQAGVKIHVQGGARQDWVFVKFSERPLKSALNVLAHLCESRWSISDGQVYFSTLERDDDDLSARAKAVEKWLDSHPVPPELSRDKTNQIIDETLRLQQSQLPDAYAQGTKLYEETPLPRAHFRLLHMLGAKELASIPQGESRLYMLSANGRIKALPAQSGGVMSDLVREREVYRSMLASRGLGQREGGSQYFGAIDGYGNSSYVEKTWILRITSEPHVFLSQITGYAEVAENMTLGVSSHYQTIPLTNDPGTAVEKDNPFSGLKEAFVVPEQWKVDLKIPEGSPNGMPTLSPQLVERLVNMDKDEVLTDYVHEPLRQLSAARSVDVVALIPDVAFMTVVFAASQATTIGGVLQIAMMTSGELEQVEGAYLVAPELRDSARRGRIPRATAAKYLREGLANDGDPGLDVTADLVVQMQDDESLMYALAVAGLAMGREPGDFMNGPLNVLRLYGHLTPSQRTMVKGAGLSLPYRNLSAAQKLLVEKMMSGRDAGLAPAGEPLTIEYTTSGGLTLEDMIQFKLPNGVPEDAVVRFRMETHNKLFSKSIVENFSYVDETSIEQLAWSQAYEEVAPNRYAKKPIGFTFADRGYLQIQIDTGPTGYFAQSMPVGGPKKDAKFIKFDELPQEMRDDFEKKLAEYRQQVKEMDIGGGSSGGRGVPPP